MTSTTGNFDTYSQQLQAVFAKLQSHADEYKHFDTHEAAPIEGTFKVNGNGSITVSLDYDELRRVKMANFRSSFDAAIAVMTEAERHLNTLLGAKPPPPPASSKMDLILQKAVEDGLK